MKNQLNSVLIRDKLPSSAELEKKEEELIKKNLPPQLPPPIPVNVPSRMDA